MRTLLALVLTAGWTLGQAPAEPEAKKNRFEGRVLTVSGAAVPRATIALRYELPASAAELSYRPTVTADDEGRFVVEDITPGTYVLQARKPGFVSEYAGSRTVGGTGIGYRVAAEQIVGGIEIRMTAQSVITGTITNPEGDPVEGVTVSLHRDGWIRGLRQLTPAGTARSDDRGAYRIANVPPGQYYLTAGAGLFAAFENKPVEKNAPKEILVDTFYPRATTLAGAATINVPAGTEVSGINVAMLRERTYTIRAVALDASGNPVPNAALIVNDRSTVFGSSIAAAVAPPRSADGRFEFTGLLPGTYAILAPPPSTVPDRNGFPPAPRLKGRAEVTISKEDVEVQVRLEPGVEVTGTVRAEAGAEDFLNQATSIRLGLGEFEIPGFNNTSAARDTDGAFHLRNVGLSTYSVSLTPLPRGTYVKSVRFGGQDVTRQPLVLSGPGTLDLVLSAKAGDVSGTVRDAKGEAILGAYVALWPVIPERSGIEGGTRDVRTEAGGTFRIDNLPPGDYYLAAWEQADGGRIPNADFRALFVSDAVKIKVEESSHLSQDPKPITPERMNAQLARLP